MRKIFITVFSISILALWLRPSISYSASQSRDEIVAHQLNCVSHQLGRGQTVQWSDICYSAEESDGSQTRNQKVASALERQERSIAREHDAAMDQLSDQSAGVTPPPAAAMKITPRESTQDDYKMALHESSAEKKNWFQNIFDRENPLRKFEFGTEVYNYGYREPSVGVKLDGTQYGVFTSYTYRLSENKPISSFKDVLSDENKINMFRLEGRFAYGELDYDGSGTVSGNPNYVGEIRGLVGYDIAMRLFRVTPFAGLGYRILKDQGKGQLTTTNAARYDRISQYFYVPTGLEFEKKFSSNWTLGAALEYDIFLRGTQKSYLGDVGIFYPVYNGLPAAENDQKGGFGYRASVKVMKENENIDFMVEPFLRYWHIEQSQDGVTCNNNGCLSGYEPENKTTEMGVKLGIRY